MEPDTLITLSFTCESYKQSVARKLVTETEGTISTEWLKPYSTAETLQWSVTETGKAEGRGEDILI